MAPAPTPSIETLARVPDHRKTSVGCMIDRGPANLVFSTKAPLITTNSKAKTRKAPNDIVTRF